MTRRWVDRLLVCLGVWVVVLLVARVLGDSPDPGLVALLVAAYGVVLWLCLDAVAQREPDGWGMVETETLRRPGEDVRLAALTRLVAGHHDARRPGPGLQRALLALVDQRLLATYGVSWRADPRRAERLLAPEVVALAHQDEPYPRMSREQVDTILTRIEEL